MTKQIGLLAKIVAGYIVLAVTVGIMAAILVHERCRLQEVEEGVSEIRSVNEASIPFTATSRNLLYRVKV